LKIFENSENKLNKMKFLSICIVLFVISIWVEQYFCFKSSSSSSSENLENEKKALKAIFQTILTYPDYMSLELDRQQKILIAFYQILANPYKYEKVIKTILKHFDSHKYEMKN
jgi:hypothetical protein